MIRRISTLLPPDQRGVLRPYLALVILGAAVRSAACVVLVPLLRELFSSDPAGAWPWVGLLTVLTVIGWVVDMTAARRGMAVGRDLMESVLERLVDRLGQVPLGWLSPDRSDEARRTLSGIGQQVFSGMSNLVTPVLTATLVPYLIGLFLLPISWPVGLVAIACAPLLQLARSASVRLLRSADEQVAAASADVDQRVVELARTQAILRGAGRAGSEGTALGEAISREGRAGLRLLGWSIPGQVIFSIASQLALLLLAVTTVSRWSAGDLTVAEAIALIVVVVRYLEPFQEASDLAGPIQALDRMVTQTTAILDAPPLPVAADPVSLDTSGEPPAVELHQVRFAHAEHEVLRNLDLSVPAGSTTAIVGPSGAGKTTILSLIARFHDVDGGTVRVGGHDVRGIEPASLLASIGIVFQDVYLFEGTARDNVAHGRPDASDEEIDAVAELARVDEIVARLPDGWETRVGEGGAALSGGERQRISIARALLKDAPLLLLDEATSAIDSENERAFLNALSTDRPRTVVIVAHREQTIAHADHVVFVDDGRVIESGTPDELVALGGRFADYWNDRRASRSWTLAGDGA